MTGRITRPASLPPKRQRRREPKRRRRRRQWCCRRGRLGVKYRSIGGISGDAKDAVEYAVLMPENSDPKLLRHLRGTINDDIGTYKTRSERASIPEAYGD